MSSLLLHNCAADASQVHLQLTDIHVSSGDSAYAQRPLLQLTSTSVVVNIRETLDMEVAVAPIQGQLNTAQYVFSHNLVFLFTM